MCSIVVTDAPAAAPGPSSAEPHRSAPPPKPLEQLEREICELSAHLAAATCRWLLMVAEYDKRDGWREWGVNSCAHWLSWRCGIGLRAGREHVRVARALETMPLVQARFASGELSYSKVRALTRVAEPATEEQLVQLALHATGGQLERIVRGYRGARDASAALAAAQLERQRLSLQWEDDGMLSVHGRLMPEDGAALVAALDRARDQQPPKLHEELGGSAGRAQALMALIKGEVEGVGPDSAPCELSVHVDVCSLAGDRVYSLSETADGAVLAPETMRRLGCDAALVTIVEQDGKPLSVGRRTRAIPPALRRALRSRDRGCRFPGCTHQRHLHAHHITHWAHGGATELSNLVQLCSHHHRLVHEGNYRVWSDAGGQVQFENPYGVHIPDVPPCTGASGPGLEQRNRAQRLRIDPRTCFPRSAGDHCDYDIAVEGLCRMAEHAAERASPGP